MIRPASTIPADESLAARWAALGAGFNIDAAPQLPDIERLLLDTARHAPDDARLIVMAVSWLADRPALVARHRLARLITTELEREHHPAMGLILELAAEASRAAKAPHFNVAIRACIPAPEAEAAPLLRSDRANPRLKALVQRRASDVSKRWGRWLDPIETKPDALRPAAFLAAKHPELRLRAAFKGDLRASILAELHADPAAGASELELARRCAATRAAIRAALTDLELGAWIEREQRGRSKSVRMLRGEAA